ncbi:OmpA family protein [Vibrio cyclitrophicus]
MSIKTFILPIVLVSNVAMVSGAEVVDTDIDKSGLWLGASGGMGFSTDSDITGKDSSIEVLSPKLELGYDFSKYFGVFGSYDYMHNFGDSDLHIGTLGLKSNVYLTDYLSVFGKLGAASIYTNDSNIMEDSFSGTVGVGLEYQLTNAVTTKLGYDYYNKLDTKDDRNINFSQLYWGLTYKFGQPKTPMIVTEEVKVPVEVVKEVERVKMSRSTYVIPYQIGKVGVNEYARYNLDDVVIVMQSTPDLTANVIGRTDSTGSMQTNLRLSGERAKNVAQYLIDNGIAEERIHVSGVANKQPLSQDRGNVELERSVQIILQ